VIIGKLTLYMRCLKTGYPTGNQSVNNDSGINIKADSILIVNFTIHAVMCAVFIWHNFN